MPFKVLIAGGGLAAAEAALALRATAGDAVAIELIAPEASLAFHPAATAEGFGDGPPRSLPLGPILADAGATYRQDRLEAVAPAVRRVRLASGARPGYDALVLALGSQRIAAVAGALTFGDQRDVPRLRRLVDDVAAGTVRRVVFAVPAGASWPLPAYELALLMAARAETCEIAVVTPERAPLAVFGVEASRSVRALLTERGVRFLGRTRPDRVDRDGALRTGLGESIPADRVVAAAELRARPVPGLPQTWQGFIPTDALGRVSGLDDVYAAGDMTDYPIKHGGLATQQADAVAAAITARLRGEPAPAPAPLELRARLLGGPEPLLLHAVLGPDGPQSREPEDMGLAKVSARHLAPYVGVG